MVAVVLLVAAAVGVLISTQHRVGLLLLPCVGILTAGVLLEIFSQPDAATPIWSAVAAVIAAQAGYFLSLVTGLADVLRSPWGRKKRSVVTDVNSARRPDGRA